MGIDFILDFSCKAKAALGEARILTLLKYSSQANAALEFEAQQESPRAPEEIMLVRVLKQPEGEQEHISTSAAELLRAAEPLKDHQQGCSDCTANILGCAYGCIGYVSYPIESDTESWLLSLLPKKLNSTAGLLLRTAFEDFGWDGSFTAELRQQKALFFSSLTAQELSWGDGPYAFRITSDQVFELLFGVGHLQPGHSQMIPLFFGLLPADIPESELSELLRDPVKYRARCQAATIPGEQTSAQTAQIAAVLKACAASAALEVPLLLDG